MFWKVLTFDGFRWLGTDLTGPFAHFRVLAGLCPGLPSRPWISDFRKRNRKAMKSHEVMRRFALFLSSTFSESVNPLDHAILCDFLFTWSWLHSGPGSWKRIVADLMANDLFDDHTAHHWSTCDIMPAILSDIMWHHVTWPLKVTAETSIDRPNNQDASAKSSRMEGKPSKWQNDAKCEVEVSLMSLQIELGAAQHKAGTLADTQQGDVDPLPWATRLGDGWRSSKKKGIVFAPAAPTPLHPASQKACPNSVPSECPGWAIAKASRVARPIWFGTKCAKGWKKVDKSWKEPTGELGSECQRNALLYGFNLDFCLTSFPSKLVFRISFKTQSRPQPCKAALHQPGKHRSSEPKAEGQNPGVSTPRHCLLPVNAIVWEFQHGLDMPISPLFSEKLTKKYHQEFQVPKMEVLNLIRLFLGWVFPYVSLTYSLYRWVQWVPPF